MKQLTTSSDETGSSSESLNYLPQTPRFDLVDLAITIAAAQNAAYKLGPKRRFHQDERQLIIDIFTGMGSDGFG